MPAGTTYARNPVGCGCEQIFPAFEPFLGSWLLFNYLGNPVAPPADLDPDYTKEGLARAMQTAAQNAGISLMKVEIDDSEFPFLIGVVFAGERDKQKLKDEIAKVPAYESSGEWEAI